MIPLRLRVSLFAALGLAMAGLLVAAFFAATTVHFPASSAHVPGGARHSVVAVNRYISLTTVTLGYVLIMLAVGACASYLIAVFALKPVSALAAAVEAIDEHNLSARVRVSEVGDEVSRLGRSFNDMMARVEQSFERQRLFAVNAAHELKTPLAAIIANLEVLRVGDRPTIAEYEAALDDVMADAHRLARLIQDLLDLQKSLEKDQYEHIGASDLVGEVIASLVDIAAAKNVCVEEHLSDAIVDGDRELLRRVFFNLVENAVKYNKDGGRVDIEGIGDDTQTVVRIRDTGMGIPEADLEKVFQPLYRVEPSRSREMGGSGLGLAIAKSIVERHGGRISMESRLGRGSEVTVTLPRS